MLLAVALTIAVAAGVGAYWFGWARYTAAPGVIGMTQHAATAKLDRAGFDVAVGDPAYSESVPKGRVITTDPGPGARVLDHGTITLTVSEGKERYAVPTLHGKTVNQAQDALLATHLTYGRSVLRWSERVPKGRVIASNPPAGKREPRDTSVDLVVSRGPAPIRVHDWTGQDAARAARVMKAQGLSVDTSDQEFSGSVPKGAVISQNPASGVLHRGDTVQLVVSKGPQLVQVPGDLRAEGVDAATQELQSLGFKVRVVHSRFYIGVGYVYSSDPSPGSMAPKGSTVTLHII